MARFAEREQRYEQVLSLHRQGLRTSDIAIQVAMGERTVRDWLAHGTYPEPKHRRHRPSLVDRYEREVLKRWEQGDPVLTAEGAPFDEAEITTGLARPVRA